MKTEESRSIAPDFIEDRIKPYDTERAEKELREWFDELPPKEKLQNRGAVLSGFIRIEHEKNYQNPQDSEEAKREALRQAQERLAIESDRIDAIIREIEINLSEARNFPKESEGVESNGQNYNYKPDFDNENAPEYRGEGADDDAPEEEKDDDEEELQGNSGIHEEIHQNQPTLMDEEDEMNSDYSEASSLSDDGQDDPEEEMDSDDSEDLDGRGERQDVRGSDEDSGDSDESDDGSDEDSEEQMDSHHSGNDGGHQDYLDLEPMNEEDESDSDDPNAPSTSSQNQEETERVYRRYKGKFSSRPLEKPAPPCPIKPPKTNKTYKQGVPNPMPILEEKFRTRTEKPNYVSSKQTSVLKSPKETPAWRILGAQKASHTNVKKYLEELGKHPRRFLTQFEQITILNNKISRKSDREIAELLKLGKNKNHIKIFSKDPVKYAVKAYVVRNALSQEAMRDLKDMCTGTRRPACWIQEQLGMKKDMVEIVAHIRQVNILAKRAKRVFRRATGRPKK